MSSWALESDLKFRETRMRPVQREWLCPKEGCEGTMVYNGNVWPTAEPGYHHTCTECKQMLAVDNVKYPTIVFLEDKDA